jgi:REP element-mobilizing transposase RayT
MTESIPNLAVMPQSLSVNLVHIIFSTKNREPMLTKNTRDRLYPYIAELIRDKGSECYRIGGVEDHIHLVIRLSKTATLSKTISEAKTGSSRWLKEVSPELSDFSWQEGYGAFSVSPKDLDSVIEYIERQEEHHKTVTFQDEFRKFLKQYKVEYDEQYVWG